MKNTNKSINDTVADTVAVAVISSKSLSVIPYIHRSSNSSIYSDYSFCSRSSSCSSNSSNSSDSSSSSHLNSSIVSYKRSVGFVGFSKSAGSHIFFSYIKIKGDGAIDLSDSFEINSLDDAIKLVKLLEKVFNELNILSDKGYLNH